MSTPDAVPLPGRPVAAPLPSLWPRVAGRCPQGCGDTLILGSGRTVICAGERCPEPTSVALLLRDPEVEHLLWVTASSWSVQHPLRERVDDALVDCPVQVALAAPALWLQPRPEGVYRVGLDTADPSGLWWERLAEPEASR